MGFQGAFANVFLDPAGIENPRVGEVDDGLVPDEGVVASPQKEGLVRRPAKRRHADEDGSSRSCFSRRRHDPQMQPTLRSRGHQDRIAALHGS